MHNKRALHYFLPYSVYNLPISNTINVSGWAGTVSTMYISHYQVILSAYIYTANLATEPWKHAVQPSNNPAGSTVWYINLGKITARGIPHTFYQVCNFQKYDAGGYATYVGALNPTLRIDKDNMYVQIGQQNMWTANAAILRISTVLNL